jgi:primosomal protein N' (replication factor Y) (superfamily II helicase)
MAKFVRVVLDQSGGNIFDYAVPDSLQRDVEPGSRVRVPVRTRTVLGTVIETLDHSEVPGVRAIDSIVGEKPFLNPLLIELGRWIADYYCCALEPAMRTILPQVIRQSRLSHRRQLFVRLVRPIEDGEFNDVARQAPRQAQVLQALRESPDAMQLSALTKQFGNVQSAVGSLVQRGLIERSERRIERDPFEKETFLPASKLQLNAEQKTALDEIEREIVTPTRPILLHGVTGSGKTEIYLQAIDYALRRGQTAVMLVPEISLTPQTVERFKSRFAETQQSVAVLHSHLSEGERHDEWHKIREGRARIVIGARSAVFAPLDNVGLIVVDEEHENSYKQEDSPRYHARDVAVVRARMEKCAVVLGSATPSIESYHNATTGKYALLRLSHRVDERTMPLIRIIDMRQEAKRGSAILSERLSAALAARLEKGEQSILFLNRRGYSTSMICPACGHVCTCDNCSIALTYHRSADKLMCHICGHVAVAPRKCPSCKDPAIRHSGVGTEKVEEAVTKIFPRAEVRRMDADAMRQKSAYRDTLDAFRSGKIDILVGTQMIAKGLHFPNVTLVGIINADLALHMPDFRSGERTFQLLTQVAGRAGRGEVEGEVFVQTYTPFSPAIQFARHHDFEGFWDQEIEFRKAWDYPPFTHMVLITVRSPHQERGQFTAVTLARRLKEAMPQNTVPGEAVPAPLEKSHGNFRFHIMLRTRKILQLGASIRSVIAKLTFPEEVTVTVDVDPYQLL